MTGTNLFVQRNINAFDSRDNLVDYSKIQVATGPCRFPDRMSVTHDPQLKVLNFCWSHKEYNEDCSNKIVNIAFYNKGNEHPRLLYDFSTVDMNTADLIVDEYEKGTILNVFIFISEDNFTRFSDSRYFKIEI